MARSAILAILVGVIALAVSLSNADERSASTISTTYTIHAMNDTVWLQFGDFKVRTARPLRAR